MSYFGQFRRKQVDSYLTSLTYNLITAQVESNLSTGVFFNEKIAELDLNSIDENGKQKGYYMKFKIYKQETSNQIITIKLINTDKNIDNVQKIKTLSLNAGLATEYMTFEMIIAPNSNYNQICFELTRTSEDFSQVNEDGTYGRTINIEIDNLSSIYNIINYLNPSIEGKGKLKQIGVQGPSGMLMCINGEEIRIGRTGIYEINYGIAINSIGFVVEPNDGKNFLMDYQY